MTQPRRIRSGRTWFLTRRTTRRHFLLRPDRNRVAQYIYLYATAVLMNKFNVRMHAMQVLSTHMHEVLTDMDGNLPAFMRERNRAIANALKCHRGWPEEVFQRAPANCVELFGPNAVIDKIAYTLCNSVDAGLVAHPDQWPGVTVRVQDLGQMEIQIARPDVYFDPENPVWPEHVTLRIDVPPAVEVTFAERAREVMISFVKARIEAARDRVLRAHRKFGRIDDIFNAPFTRRASSFEPPRSGDPTLAWSGDHEQRELALADRREFLRAYRNALEGWRAGLANARFPEGTWRWCRELPGPLKSHQPANVRAASSSVTNA